MGLKSSSATTLSKLRIHLWVSTLALLAPAIALGKPYQPVDIYRTCKVTRDSTWNGLKVDCTHRNLSSFPTLPSNTTTAILKGNIFKNLKRQSLAHLTELRVLCLRECQIKKIDHDAFQSLGQLNELNLESNGLRNMSSGLLRPLKRLKTLCLSGNRDILGNVFEDARRKMFQGLESLENLHLASTALTAVPSGMFSKNQNLSLINLSNNKLKRIPEDITALPYLKGIELSGNQISSLRLGNPINSASELHVWLKSNAISKITREDMKAYSRIHGLTLDIQRNHLTHVATDTFADFKYISGLVLSGNPICKSGRHGSNCIGLQNLTKSLHSMSVNSLNLDKIGLNVYNLTGDYFVHLSNSNVTELSLNGNTMTVVHHTAFLPLKHLRTLNLGNCDIETFQLVNLGQLQTLKLPSNKLQSFEILSEILEKCLKLSELDLSSTFKETGDEDCVIKNHGSLRSLTLSRNNLCKSIVLRNMTSLQTVKMANVTAKKSFNMAKQLHMSMLPSLTTFEFQNNRAYLSKKADIFNNVPTLTELCLDNNQFYRILSIDLDILRDLLRPLRHLRCLSLTANKLTELPLGMFDGLANLTTLDLNLNSLRSLPVEIFRHQRQMTDLHLDRNSIFTLSGHMFANLTALKNFNYARNKIICDCNIRSFQSWLATTSVNVQGPRELCFGPEWAQKTPIKEFRPSWFACDDHSVYLAAISGGCVFFVIFLSAVLYSFRWDILYIYAIYRASGKKSKLGRREPHKTYDAIAMYSPTSVTWIKKHLIPNLERGEDIRFKLCINDRDYIVGDPLVDNVETNMEKSRRILFLLTREYFESQLHETEINLAQVKLFDGFVDKIIFVFLEEVPKTTFKEPLKTMMRHGNCLHWPRKKRVRERTIFWKRLKLALLEARYPVRPGEKTPLLVNENN
ncbi:toll-like receptor 3 [Lingula anatina]|uniref:Toll-like receptor 3 n=1 Tax=Lingula anatina TaxID=7574 RepID=A0A1S3JM83_LINAN|nr:toll-like receptor 3 [Lingula anatina]|eukprot:XP_013411236.1 toll-like receptor 3 [Lingula anatina]